MALLSLLLALALEQWRPLVDRRRVFAPVANYASWLETKLNAGEHHHGIVAWMLVLLPVLALTLIVFTLLHSVSGILALLFNVAVLYVTMGFRQESHFFTDIHQALKEGDIERARTLLSEWRGHYCEDLSVNEIVRLSIESALATSHRHVFGVMFWFILLPGPTGAVMYRIALFLYHKWGGGLPTGIANVNYAPDTAMGVETDFLSTMAGEASQILGSQTLRKRFGEFSKAAFELIDALPARFTAGAFAIVGDFEDAVYCWRAQAGRWSDRLLGIVIAAGAGALGVRLGGPIVRAGLIHDRPEVGLGEEADVPALDSTVGLVWRALLLWLAVLLLVTLAVAVA